MTTFAVTGTSGHLGRLIVESMLARGVAAADIVAIARTTAKVSDLAERGVQVRFGDYKDAASLDAALDGVTRLVLVSSSEVGKRSAQHAAVIDAAERAGVSRIVYTSILKADTSTLGLAPEHVETEAALRASAIPATVLRNSWYLENYTGQIGQYVATGTLLGATGGARLTAGTRSDFADAAAVAAIQDDEGATYEIGGVAFTIDELASTVTAVTGTTVTHRDVSVDELSSTLQEAAGMDAGTAGFWASVDASIARGDLFTESTDLERLIGRPPVSLESAVRAAI
ncbi:NAD(P)H-binding protein [Demequina muriae]|uniref:NAD(P)H-binding protein n=1 Tax=Demequina muriae TaxID=3051664 RepID=A0ABT8GI82_9MICO|nr:NAD(P)H-binding protein [Demequina sp. EGI L300058]MDN4481089.1 NAD(P)H-binding protein [Demequina sp. EGI L300058]